MTTNFQAYLKSKYEQGIAQRDADSIQRKQQASDITTRQFQHRFDVAPDSVDGFLAVKDGIKFLRESDGAWHGWKVEVLCAQCNRPAWSSAHADVQSIATAYCEGQASIDHQCLAVAGEPAAPLTCTPEERKLLDAMFAVFGYGGPA